MANELGTLPSWINGSITQSSDMNNPTPSATYTPTEDSANTTTSNYSNQPSTGDSQGLYGADQTSLAQLLNLAKPTLEYNNKLVNEKNMIYKQTYMGDLTDEEKADLTPSTKLAIESGNRTLMDAQVRAINNQLSGYVSGIDNSISDYLGSVAKMQESRDNIVKNIATNPEVAQLYDPATLQSMGINASSVGVGVVGGYDMGNYATNPNNVNQLNQIYSNPTLQAVSDADSAQTYINQYAPNSPITGQMIMDVAQQTGVDPKMLLTVAQNESNFGTKGEATWTFNPGNVGNTDSGSTVNDGSWENGLMAMANNLSGRYVGNNSGQTAAGITQSGDPSIDSQDPNYYSAIIPNSGGQTQAEIDMGANYMISHGGSLPPGIGLSSSGAGLQKKNSIAARASQLSNGQNISLNPAALPALKQQTEYAATMQRSINTADDNLQILMQAADNVNSSDSPLINEWTNQVKAGVIGSGDLNAYQAAIQTVRSEYANILGRGATPTDAMRSEAATLIPDNITKAQLQQVVGVIQTEGQNVIQNANDQINTIKQGMSGGSSEGSVGSPSSGDITSDYQQWKQSQSSSNQPLVLDTTVPWYQQLWNNFFG